MKLTKEEKTAIAALERLAKRWPKSLWLFSANGTLCVMKKDSSGRKVQTPHGGVDSDYVATTIGIENDGGDW